MSIRRLLVWFVLLVVLMGAVRVCVAIAARAGVFAGPPPAAAAVEHGEGFVATVDGFRSWYGSYRLGDLGLAWCIDHGIPAPDAAFAYQPTPLDDRTPAVSRAVAWAVGRFGPEADRAGGAALMLALHDLMAARYPSGRLDVDILDPGRLTGFAGQENEVLERARAIKAEALAHAGFRPPYTLEAALDRPAGEVVAGRPATLSARLLDGNGVPIAGALLHPAAIGLALLGPVDQVTDSDGRVAWPFEPAPGANSVTLSAVLPSLEPDAFAPTLAMAQRVVRPSTVVVSAGLDFSALVPRTLTIVKRGDGEPWLPVAGARFSVAGAGEVVAGADGRTTPVEVLPGSYVVEEVEAPAGYARAGPWTVEVDGSRDVTLDVRDEAIRGTLAIEKVDEATGDVVTGATFAVAWDPGGDGTFDQPVPDPGAPLLPGRYSVTEVSAPPGYRRATQPVTVDVPAGGHALVRVANTPTATIAFHKEPALAGARFAVSDQTTGAGAGECVTGHDGRCSLPPGSLDAGRPYCWGEVEAPPGWSKADGACLRTGGAGSVTTVVVVETPLPPPPPPTTVPSPVEAERAEAPVGAPTPGAPPPELLVSELPRTGSALHMTAAAGVGLVGLGLVLVALPTRSRPGRHRAREMSNFG